MIHGPHLDDHVFLYGSQAKKGFYVFIYFFKIFIYLFIFTFGCVGSSLLRAVFL